MRDLLKTLGSCTPLVSDGAWGTLLQKQGLAAGECPEAWNLSHPEAVAAVARSYVEAGADLILTNSFGGNPTRLTHFDLAEKTFELNKAGAVLSRREAGERVFVLGSMGPTGALLAMGEVSEEEVYRGFRLQGEALAAGGVDALLVETMADPAEAAQAVKAAREGTGLSVACTFTFKKDQKGSYRTMMGATVEEAIGRILEAGATIVGTNCGYGFKEMIEIATVIRALYRDVPILVHANAGMPVYQDGKTVYPESPEHMASLTPALVQAGASIVGGCCGTSPDHIRAIVKALRG